MPDASTPRAAALVAAVAADFETWQVPWLTALVETPSHTWAPADVEQAARMLDAEAEALGLHTTRVPDPEGRFAAHRVYASPAAAKGAPGLALIGHIDTVFPRSMGFLRFERDGQIARGPGVLDMKSGLTAMFGALRALRAVDPDAYAALPIRLVVVSDEEVGSPSSRSMWTELAPLITAGLVFEAGRDGDRVVVARKGSAECRITTHGRAAHAGNHHADGINAIHALALLVPQVEALTDYDAGTTVNVGLIEGGTARNTIPDRAQCTIDARFVTAEASARLLEGLEALSEAGALPERLRAARIEVDAAVKRPPMETTPAMKALAERYGGHARAVGLAAGPAPLQGGGSDANLLAAAGVPCIDGLGPYGKHFHRRDEWCDLDSLRRRTQALATFLAEAAS